MLINEQGFVSTSMFCIFNASDKSYHEVKKKILYWDRSKSTRLLQQPGVSSVWMIKEKGGAKQYRQDSHDMQVMTEGRKHTGYRV